MSVMFAAALLLNLGLGWHPNEVKETAMGVAVALLEQDIADWRASGALK
jgi:hypothetical protein